MLISSFSADRKGYNAYLKSIGVNPKDTNAILMFAIPFEQFKSIDRRSLEDKIAHARNMTYQMHDEWVDADKNGLTATAEIADKRWDYWANQWNLLTKECVASL